MKRWLFRKRLEGTEIKIQTSEQEHMSMNL